VDLGRYEHDHRAVSGPTGLSDMSRHVGTALLRAVEAHGVSPEYDTLPDRYREVGAAFVEQYAADAGFNGLAYDRSEEREQVDIYAEAIVPPGEDRRLPAWREVGLAPGEVLEVSRRDVSDLRD
jgi:glucosyl-3-phosphoglycerate synthase